MTLLASDAELINWKKELMRAQHRQKNGEMSEKLLVDLHILKRQPGTFLQRNVLISGFPYFHYSPSVCTRTKDGHKHRCDMTDVVRHISTIGGANEL